MSIRDTRSSKEKDEGVLIWKLGCYSVLREALPEARSGDDSEMATPVPIPNTEVKHFNGEDSTACPCEKSKSPGLFLFPVLQGFFILRLIKLFILFMNILNNTCSSSSLNAVRTFFVY